MSGFASARPARLPDAGFKLSVMRSWHTGQSRSSDDRGWSCDSGRLWQVRLNLKDRRVLWSIRHLVFTELRWSRKSHSKARKATPCHTTTPIISIDGKLRQVPRWSDRSLPVSWSAWHAGSQRASMRRKVSQLCRASSRASTWAMHGPCMCILRSLVSWDGECQAFVEDKSGLMRVYLSKPRLDWHSASLVCKINPTFKMLVLGSCSENSLACFRCFQPTQGRSWDTRCVVLSRAWCLLCIWASLHECYRVLEASESLSRFLKVLVARR